MSTAQLPVRRVVREVPEEEREYEVTLHAPYRFAQEIVAQARHLVAVPSRHRLTRPTTDRARSRLGRVFQERWKRQISEPPLFRVMARRDRALTISLPGAPAVQPDAPELRAVWASNETRSTEDRAPGVASRAKLILPNCLSTA